VPMGAGHAVRRRVGSKTMTADVWPANGVHPSGCAGFRAVAKASGPRSPVMPPITAGGDGRRHPVQV
jgi:hypothetical protein